MNSLAPRAENFREKNRLRFAERDAGEEGAIPRGAPGVARLMQMCGCGETRAPEFRRVTKQSTNNQHGKSIKIDRLVESRRSRDRILDRGIVVDVWAKLSLVGIELVSIEARVVIASVETYLKYAEAIGLTATAAAPA